MQQRGRSQANLYGAYSTVILLVLEQDPSVYDLPVEASWVSGIKLPNLSSPFGSWTMMAALTGLGIGGIQQVRTEKAAAYEEKMAEKEALKKAKKSS